MGRARVCVRAGACMRACACMRVRARMCVVYACVYVFALPRPRGSYGPGRQAGLPPCASAVRRFGEHARTHACTRTRASACRSAPPPYCAGEASLARSGLKLHAAFKLSAMLDVLLKHSLVTEEVALKVGGASRGWPVAGGAGRGGSRAGRGGCMQVRSVCCGSMGEGGEPGRREVVVAGDGGPGRGHVCVRTGLGIAWGAIARGVIGARMLACTCARGGGGHGHHQGAEVRCDVMYSGRRRPASRRSALSLPRTRRLCHCRPLRPRRRLRRPQPRGARAPAPPIAPAKVPRPITLGPCPAHGDALVYKY